jgi:hypothetical protein
MRRGLTCLIYFPVIPLNIIQGRVRSTQRPERHAELFMNGGAGPTLHDYPVFRGGVPLLVLC